MKNRHKFCLFECFIEKCDRFFNKTYRERYNFKLLDTCLCRQAIFNSKAVALLLKTTRSDG